MMAGSKAPEPSDVPARVYNVGPILWIKRAARHQSALEGAGCRELVAQVQPLLLQANNGTSYVINTMPALRWRLSIV